MPTRRGTKTGAEPAQAAATPPPPLALSLQFVDATHRSLLPRPRVARWLRAALAGTAELTVRIVGAEEGRALNREFRGKDHATNVLTFALQREPVVVADIVLCAPVVEREAAEQGIALEAHYAHLLVHGALHAQGYDHETGEADAFEMEALEILLLGALGYPNPY